MSLHTNNPDCDKVYQPLGPSGTLCAQSAVGEQLGLLGQWMVQPFNFLYFNFMFSFVNFNYYLFFKVFKFLF